MHLNLLKKPILSSPSFNSSLTLLFYFHTLPMAGVREQDQYMPIANVIRIMRRILPSHAKISDDAKETIQECVSEYISFITAEANERCQREQRKTVTADDLLWAMGKLGFDDYVQPLTLYLQRYRESEGEPASVRRGYSLAMPPPPPPQPQYPNSSPAMVPSSSGNYYGYGFGVPMVDFDQELYRDNDAAPSSSGSASFGPSFDYSFPQVKRDSM